MGEKSSNEKRVGSASIGTTDKPNSPVEETDETKYQTCVWNGHIYSPGSYVCRGNTKMICQPNGTWLGIVVPKCE